MTLVHWHYDILDKTIQIKGSITVPVEIIPFVGMLFYKERKTYRIETQPIFCSYDQSENPVGSWSFEVREV